MLAVNNKENSLAVAIINEFQLEEIFNNVPLSIKLRESAKFHQHALKVMISVLNKNE